MGRKLDRRAGDKPVRLKVEVYARLVEWTRRAVLGYSNHRCEKWWEGDEPTISEAIAELLRRSERSRCRSQASVAMRTARRAEGRKKAPSDS